MSPPQHPQQPAPGCGAHRLPGPLWLPAELSSAPSCPLKSPARLPYSKGAQEGKGEHAFPALDPFFRLVFPFPTLFGKDDLIFKGV